MVADGGVYCVQSVEAKDAVTAKHPPIATQAENPLGPVPGVSLLRLRNARGAVMKQHLVHPREDLWTHY